MTAAQLDEQKFKINSSVAFIYLLYANNFDPLQKFRAAFWVFGAKCLAPILKLSIIETTPLPNPLLLLR